MHTHPGGGGGPRRANLAFSSLSLFAFDAAVKFRARDSQKQRAKTERERTTKGAFERQQCHDDEGRMIFDAKKGTERERERERERRARSQFSEGVDKQRERSRIRGAAEIDDFLHDGPRRILSLCVCFLSTRLGGRLISSAFAVHTKPQNERMTTIFCSP